MAFGDDAGEVVFPNRGLATRGHDAGVRGDTGDGQRRCDQDTRDGGDEIVRSKRGGHRGDG